MPKMSRESVEEVRAFLLANIPDHPRDIASVGAERFGLTRQAINRHLRALTKQGLILAKGVNRAREYELAQQVQQRVFELDGTLQEDIVWSSFVAPLVKHLPRIVYDICHHGLTEMVNNAIDHSEGRWVMVNVALNPAGVRLVVQDDGIGIFRKIQQRLALEDERHAVLELAKGKLTTDPARHSGEGIFFTSRMFDEFSLLSGSLFFSHVANANDWLLETARPGKGTRVTMEISAASTRTIQEVFETFTTEFSFDKTYVPVSLARVGEDNLISRSQAKRLLSRVEKFKIVVLDFDKVATVGQAFADEIFRVFSHQHPETELIALNANEQVGKMIRRAREGA